MANNNSKFPEYYYEGLYETSAAAYRPNLANSTFPHQPEYLVTNSYCGVMMKSEARTSSTMSQTSQDSGYGSELCSPIDLAPESLHFPTSSQYFDCHSFFEDQLNHVWGDVAPTGRGFTPSPSRSHPRPSKSPEKAPNTTSSSNTSNSLSSTSPKSKPYCCMWPRCEATFARAYDLGRHQKTKHTNLKRFDCPEENCRRYGIPESRGERGGFTRLDHFRDHVKNLHGKNVIKDKDRDGGQHWVLDLNEGDKRFWMRDETGSIMMKDSMGRKWSKDAKTGLWRQISLEEPVLCQIGPAMSRPRT